MELKSRQYRWSDQVPSGARLAGMVAADAHADVGAGSMMPAANISVHFAFAVVIAVVGDRKQVCMLGSLVPVGVVI